MSEERCLNDVVREHAESESNRRFDERRASPRKYLKAVCMENDLHDGTPNKRTPQCQWRSTTNDAAPEDSRFKLTVDDVIQLAEQHVRTTGHRILLHGSIGKDNE